MIFRWGPGPVLFSEVISASRRRSGHLLRAILGAALLIALWIAWLGVERYAELDPRGAQRYLAQLGERLYYGLAGIQVTLALLVAPAATAGAVCVDRARGWLAHLFVTELSNTDIVLGKLAARLAWTFALVLAGVPVLAICTLMGGVVPDAVVVLTAATLAICLLGCALALALSVRAAKTHEVLMVVFTVWVIWLLSYPVWAGLASSGLLPRAPDWFAKLNPFVLVYSPYVKPGYVDLIDVVLFVATATAFSLIAVALAVRWLRQDLRPLGERSARVDSVGRFVRAHLFSWWPSPSLDGSPVLWREWHRNRPSRMAGFVARVFVVATIVGAAIGIREAAQYGVGVGHDDLLGVCFCAVAFGLLLLSVTAPTTLTEERVRGSLDVLMSTPLPTRTIVLGKWWATYRRTLPLLLLPSLAGLFVATAMLDAPFYLPPQMMHSVRPANTADRLLAGILPVAFLAAHAAAVTSLGLALATWLRHTGRAVAVSVAAFVIMAIGWPLTIALAIRPILEWWLGAPWGSPEMQWAFTLEQALVALSPMGGQTSPSDILRNGWSSDRTFAWWALLIELAIVVLVAAAFLGLTLLTFNRCMGRMNERIGGYLSVPERQGRSTRRLAVPTEIVQPFTPPTLGSSRSRITPPV
jgi:ABC-type transport system involved in multi-copper enzyme maturation permease subunit